MTAAIPTCLFRRRDEHNGCDRLLHVHHTNVDKEAVEGNAADGDEAAARQHGRGSPDHGGSVGRRRRPFAHQRLHSEQPDSIILKGVWHSAGDGALVNVKAVVIRRWAMPDPGLSCYEWPSVLNW